MSSRRGSRGNRTRFRARGKGRKRSGQASVSITGTSDDAEPKEVAEFGGNVHAYGAWLRDTGQAVSSDRDSSKRIEEYQSYLWEHGKEYTDELSRYNTSISSSTYGKKHDVFLLEQELRSRRMLSREIYDTGNQGDVMKQEIQLGLGDHRNVSLLKKHSHAPIPWEALDPNGVRIRDVTTQDDRAECRGLSLATKLGEEGYGVALLLDAYQDAVLFQSTKAELITRLMQSLQSFYAPDGRDRALARVYVPSFGVSVERDHLVQWEKVFSSNGSVQDFLPKAFVSWFDDFVRSKLMRLELAEQRTVVHALVNPHLRGNKESSTARVARLSKIMDMRVGLFYSFIKQEYGLSAHIVDKDPVRNIAVISFEITHRYHFAIFFDIRTVPFYKTQHRLCNYLINYIGLVTHDERLVSKSSSSHYVERMMRKLDAGIERLVEEEYERGNLEAVTRTEEEEEAREKEEGAGRRSMEHSGLLMRNLLERDHRGFTGEGMDTKRAKQRKLSILNAPTTGIIEIVLYACVCRRAPRH